MKLVVHEIKTDPLFQTIVPTKNRNVGVIRPHLYIKGVPAGNLKVQLTSSDGTLLAESASVAISSILAVGEFHGYVSFYLNAFLKKSVSYQVNVVASGYTFSESAFVGLVGGYELKKYPNLLPATHPRTAPLDLEIWTNSEK